MMLSTFCRLVASLSCFVLACALPLLANLAYAHGPAFIAFGPDDLAGKTIPFDLIISTVLLMILFGALGVHLIPEDKSS